MSLAATRKAWLPLIVPYLAAGVAVVIFADVARDEGWYLLAGWMVHQGRVPYIDFPYFQAPLLPVVQSLLMVIPHLTLEAGRALSFLCSLLTVLLVLKTTLRLGGRFAAALATLSFLTSTHALYHLNYVSNLPPGTCLAFLAAYLLLFSEGRFAPTVAAVVLGVLAAATRLSFGFYALFLLGVAAWQWRHDLRRVLVLAGSAGLTGLLCLGPFLIAAPDKVLFNLVGAQVARRAQYGVNPAQLSAPPAWQWWLTSLSMFAFGVGIFATALAFIVLNRKGAAGRETQTRRCLFLSAAMLIVYLPNLIPGDVYPNYLVPSLPFMASVGGIGIAAAWARLRPIARASLTIWLAALGAWSLLASAMYLPHIMSPQPQLGVLAETGAYLAEQVPVSASVFTFETPLAVAANRGLPSGMEMSYFSYFPTWSTERCREFHLINNELVTAALADGNLGAIALTDFDLFLLRNRSGSLESTPPDPMAVFPELRDRYYLARTVPDFGLFGNRLYILLPLQKESLPVSEPVVPAIRDTFTGK